MRTASVVLLAAGLILAYLGIRWLPSDRKDASANQPVHKLTVAAAADLKFALDDVITAFEQRHPDVRVEATYGSSGNFYAQLQNKAPFDLFLSADVDYPRRLIDQGLALRESEFVYAIGHVVVWVPRASPLDLESRGVQALLDPSVRKIALANPRFAPYGRAAEAALKSLQVYDRVKDRLIYGDNVAQAAQFVQAGAADAGLIGLSQALSPALREHGRYWELPVESYPRLEQGGVILAWVKDREPAERFRAFVRGEEGKAILRRHGFSLPDNGK
jgi:molybdate transport system substrate-binding protein